MSQWTEKYNKHPIHNTLSNLETLLDEIPIDQFKFKDKETDIPKYERIRNIVHFIKNRLNSSDPELISSQSLKNLNNNLQLTYNEIKSFKNNKNVAHLSNAI